MRSVHFFKEKGKPGFLRIDFASDRNDQEEIATFDPSAASAEECEALIKRIAWWIATPDGSYGEELP
jgi:hypothetical protein